MSWQVYISLAVVGLSVAILLQRELLSRYKLDPGGFAVLFQLLVAVTMLPLVLVHGYNAHGFADLLLPITLSSVGFGVGSVIYGKALQRIDASVFSVLFATQALWIMACGIWLLHEKLSMLQTVGSLFIFASVALLAKNVRSHRIHVGILFGIATGMFFGIAIAATSYVSRHMDLITWSFLAFVFGGFGSLAADPSSVRRMRPIFRAKALRLVLILCVVYAAGNLAMMYAYKYGPFSLVAPIRQTGIIVTTLLAFALMRSERTNIARKLTAAAMCTFGVILLVI